MSALACPRFTFADELKQVSVWIDLLDPSKQVLARPIAKVPPSIVLASFAADVSFAVGAIYRHPRIGILDRVYPRRRFQSKLRFPVARMRAKVIHPHRRLQAIELRSATIAGQRHPFPAPLFLHYFAQLVPAPFAWDQFNTN